MKQLLPLLGAAALVGAVALSPLGCPAARAQGSGMVPGTNSQGVPNGPVVAPAPQGPASSGAPTALPGTQRANAPIAPDRPPSEMDPNQALFDAINRGDVSSARDAVNRGADLAAKNVLGLTPTELSIDLGRNDITFLLLAQRGADRDVFGTQANPGDRPGAKSAVAHGKPAKPKTVAVKQAPAAPVREAAAEASAVPRYATTPGTPVPQDGFLGFGPDR